MIGPNDYNPSFYAPVASQPLAAPKVNNADAQAEARAADDFARLLNGPAPTPVAHTVPPVAPTEEAQEDSSIISFFKGVLDVINPLHHIPVVGAIYRHITGDEISNVSKLAGSTLYGGPIGAALAAADITYEKITGHDAGETMIAALTPDNAQPQGATTQIAHNLSRMEPAAGGADIIWNDEVAATRSRLSSTPPLPHQGTNGLEPANTPTPKPVLIAKDDVIPTLLSPTASKVDSTTVLQPQEAPATALRKGAAPELIAAHMMDALDKYSAMKSSGLAPTMSGVY